MKELDLVVIGDLAFDEIISGRQKKSNIAGGVYNVALSASLITKDIGIVSRVGEDFPLENLISRGINTEGIFVVIGGKTSRFRFIYHADGDRQYREDRGVASGLPDPEIFPPSYLSVKYIHLPGSPPSHCLVWLKSLISGNFKFSVDIFESFVEQEPELTKAVMEKASMIFLNEKELELLKGHGEVLFKVPYILKRGAKGAIYNDGQKIICIPAPFVEVMDTTGAGDVLAGTFLALRAKGSSIGDALKEAVRVASYSTTQFGVEHILDLPADGFRIRK